MEKKRGMGDMGEGGGGGGGGGGGVEADGGGEWEGWWGGGGANVRLWLSVTEHKLTLEKYSCQ